MEPNVVANAAVGLLTLPSGTAASLPPTVPRPVRPLLEDVLAAERVFLTLSGGTGSVRGPPGSGDVALEGAYASVIWRASINVLMSARRVLATLPERGPFV